MLFKDRCTNEAAMNPPAVAPQQTGALEAPVQQASNAVQYQATPSNALPQSTDHRAAEVSRAVALSESREPRLRAGALLLFEQRA